MIRVPTSSAYHLFAHLLVKRNRFRQRDELANFAFPSEIIAGGSKSGFPDMVLRTNRSGRFSGGEFIELKETNSYSIASFNSTLPTATKSVSVLTRPVRRALESIGENPDALPERDVYYLIRGKIRKPDKDLSKTLLVGGKFFETVPVDEVLTDAFAQVAADSANPGVDVSDIMDKLSVQQRYFSATRRVTDSGFTVRFRVMGDVDPDANLLTENKYPMIGDNTLTFLAHDTQIPADARTTRQFDWQSAPAIIRNCTTYELLNVAIEDVEPSLKNVTRLSVMRHPLNGPFFMAQADI